MLTGSVDAVIVWPPIDGIDRPIRSLRAIQPSITEMSSFLASSMVLPVAHAPGSSGTETKIGSSSSMVLYTALSKAASIYSENISRFYWQPLEYNVYLHWAQIGHGLQRLYAATSSLSFAAVRAIHESSLCEAYPAFLLQVLDDGPQAKARGWNSTGYLGSSWPRSHVTCIPSMDGWGPTSACTRSRAWVWGRQGCSLAARTACRNPTEQGWPGRTLVKNDQFEFLAKVCIKFNILWQYLISFYFARNSESQICKTNSHFRYGCTAKIRRQ